MTTCVSSAWGPLSPNRPHTGEPAACKSSSCQCGAVSVEGKKKASTRSCTTNDSESSSVTCNIQHRIKGTHEEGSQVVHVVTGPECKGQTGLERPESRVESPKEAAYLTYSSLLQNELVMGYIECGHWLPSLGSCSESLYICGAFVDSLTSYEQCTGVLLVSDESKHCKHKAISTIGIPPNCFASTAA